MVTGHVAGYGKKWGEEVGNGKHRKEMSGGKLWRRAMLTKGYRARKEAEEEEEEEEEEEIFGK